MPLTYKVGDTFPDIALADQSGEMKSISQVADGQPLILVLYRGYW